jgi:glycopeptide antibiotics resistance protein
MFALNDNQYQQTSTHQYDLPTYKIALTLILGFTIIFFIALIGYPDKLELVDAIWGVLIGAIIGYFFGSQFSDGNENLGQQLARSQEESKIYEISVLNETAKKNKK